MFSPDMHPSNPRWWRNTDSDTIKGVLSITKGQPGYRTDEIREGARKELLRRERETFKEQEGFTDADEGTDLFEVLFRLWLKVQP